MIRTAPIEQIDPAVLERPAGRPELVVHMGTRNIIGARKGHGPFPAINAGLRSAGITPRVVEICRQSREASNRDDRFHLVFHGRKRGPRFLNFKLGYLKEFYYCDPAGFSGYASFARETPDFSGIDPDAARAWRRCLIADYVGQDHSKHAHPPSGPVIDGAIAVFLQVRRDVVLRLARFSMEQMLDALIAARGGRPLMIKRHPLCNDPHTAALLERLHDPTRGIHVTNAALHPMLAAASHVAVINSGTGFEALLHDRPVLTFGATDYDAAAYPIHQPEDIARALAHTAPPLDTALFLDWYLRRKMISPRFGNLGLQILPRIRALKRAAEKLTNLNI